MWSPAGSNECFSCPPGTQVNAGNSACVACGAGTYSNGGSTCQPCPLNTFSLAGAHIVQLVVLDYRLMELEQHVTFVQ